MNSKDSIASCSLTLGCGENKMGSTRLFVLDPPCIAAWPGVCGEVAEWECERRVGV